MSCAKIVTALALISAVAAAQAQEEATPPAHDIAATEVQLIPAPSHIAADVDAAASGFAKAAEMTPGLVASAMGGFRQHGLRWFFYGDTRTQAEANKVGRTLGGALASFASALRTDMAQVARTQLGHR